MGRDDVTTKMGGDTKHITFHVPNMFFFFFCYYFLYNILTLQMARDTRHDHCISCPWYIFYIALNMLTKNKVVYEKGLKTCGNASQAHISSFQYYLSSCFENRWHDSPHFILNTNLVDMYLI